MGHLLLYCYVPTVYLNILKNIWKFVKCAKHIPIKSTCATCMEQLATWEKVNPFYSFQNVNRKDGKIEIAWHFPITDQMGQLHLHPYAAQLNFVMTKS